MFSFLPSTKALFSALQFEWPEPENEEQAQDPDPINAALTEWQNALYYQLSTEELDHGTWPASAELIDALRAALADQRGNGAGYQLAYCLVRCGQRDPDIIAGLSLCDSQLFRWNAAGLSAGDLLARFQAVGVAGNPADGDLDKLNHWLSDPATALANYSFGNLSSTVLKGRTIIGNLYDGGDGSLEYAQLFGEWAGKVEPALPISKVSQMPMEGGLVEVTEAVQAQMGERIPPELKDTPIFEQSDNFWKISFELDGVPNAVYVPGKGAWINEAGLAVQFDAILARLGRKERVLKIGDNCRNPDSFYGRYIIAPPREFSALCRELGIPLVDFTGCLGTDK